MLNLSLFLFSFLLFLLSLTWPSLLGMWVCMEAANMIVLTGFFNFCISVNRYSGLLGAILISGISSGLLFMGFISDSYLKVFLISLILKIGMFPFVSWVVAVLINSPWLVFYFISSVSKVSLIYFHSFVSSLTEINIAVFYFLTFVFLMQLLISGVSGFKMLLAISSVSTGSLLLLFLNGLGVYSVSVFLGVYLVYNLIFMSVIASIEVGLLDSSKTVVSSFVVLGVPFSVSILYKLVGSYFVSFFSFPFIFLWVLYSCLEFVYVVLWLFEKSSVNESW
nr:NADH dehydrogenase subunit 2 [Cichlidogyrus tilapiae]